MYDEFGPFIDGSLIELQPNLYIPLYDWYKPSATTQGIVPYVINKYIYIYIIYIYIPVFGYHIYNIYIPYIYIPLFGWFKFNKLPYRFPSFLSKPLYLAPEFMAWVHEIAHWSLSGDFSNITLWL